MTGMGKAWDIGYHPQLQKYFLFLPAGLAADGTALTYATPLQLAEVILWQRGEVQALHRCLRQRGIPLPGAGGIREGKFRRFLKALRAKLLGGVDV